MDGEEEKEECKRVGKRRERAGEQRTGRQLRWRNRDQENGRDRSRAGEQRTGERQRWESKDQENDRDGDRAGGQRTGERQRWEENRRTETKKTAEIRAEQENIEQEGVRDGKTG
ncbi:hypothetical protein Pcinc_025624 [Petrolisthes cinctipes]|uniref:Uncharacterized protein n=1 Tax=Petrolisthes cinctipes TaxID=88211 RepID=A0AAE1KDI0_PETCI|nr:hypothetical protein Pcinc_025624 [Petrolisthes cinctipes]